jgi:hypothetical protein
MPRRPVLIAAALVLGGCAATPEQELDLERLHDPDRIVRVEVELAPGDWDSLRTQTRSWVEVYERCLSGPFESPFTSFPAAVTVDGVRIEAAEIRKRGFLGSLDEDRPSLKVGLDGVDLILNNARQDASTVRSCLAYRTFAAAGLPAPRCNFARVSVNGADLGLYVHVEEIDEAFLARHFPDPGGNLYEGTFSDFRDGWTATFELETNRARDDRSDLARVVDALERPDSELIDALEAVVDLEQLFRFWAVETLIARRDGYASSANNYFAYHDPASDRFHLIPWGADLTFLPGVAVHAGSIAPWRLYRLPGGRERYAATVRQLLDEVWDEEELIQEVDRIEALLDEDLRAALDEVRGFIRGRRATILAELDAGELPVTLRDPPCFEHLGAISGESDTSWGTVGADAFASGGGALDGVIEDVPLDVTGVGSTAGWADDERSQARIIVVGALAGGDAEMLVFDVDPSRFRAGSTVAIDWVEASGLAYHYSGATQELVLVGLLAGGTLHLAVAATSTGSPVRASFTGPVVRSPF